MKKGLKIIGGVSAIIILLLLLLPFVWRGKIGEILKKELNKAVTAQVDFAKLGLDFFDNFPNATATLSDLSVVGTGPFSADTLLSARQVRVTINLQSLFGDKGYEVKKVQLLSPRIRARIGADGAANWDILSHAETTATRMPPAKEEISSLKLCLEDLEVKNAWILFQDIPAETVWEIRDWDISLAGELGAEATTLQARMKMAALTYRVKNIPLLDRAVFEAHMDIAADRKQNKFAFRENTIRLNAIEAEVDGWFSLPDSGAVAMDMKLNTSRVAFKELLSLVPALYAKDFQSLQTAGNLTLAVSARGMMKGEIYPAFDLRLEVDKAMFRYPSLPKAVTGITIRSHIYSPGGSLDRTVVDIPQVDFTIGDNPFGLTVYMTTPLSDPDIRARAKGKLDLGMIKEVYPLNHGTELKGVFEMDLSVEGRMSYLEKQQYDRFDTDGILRLSGLSYHSPLLPEIKIAQADLTFDPRFVRLDTFAMTMGKSDLQASGTLQHLLEYLVKGTTLQGNLAVASTYLNLNDLMVQDRSAIAARTVPDTAVPVALQIPRNIDFSLTAHAKDVLFQQLTLRHVQAELLMRDGRVTLRDLSAAALGGEMTVSGFYEAPDVQQPQADLSVEFKNVSFAQTFNTLQLARSMAPVFENMQGNYSMRMRFSTLLDGHMQPVVASLAGDGRLQSQNVRIQDVKVLDLLAGTLNDESLRTFTSKDLDIPFQIRDGRIYTAPFDTEINDIGVNLSGSTGIDGTVDYGVRITLPPRLVQAGVSRLNGSIKGTFSNPNLSLDAGDVLQQAAGDLLNKWLGGKKEKKDTAVAGAQDNRSVREQAAEIRRRAKEAGDKLIEEAEKQGQKLVERADSPFLKSVANAGAKELKKEAEKQAAKLNEKAEEQIRRLSGE